FLHAGLLLRKNQHTPAMEAYYTSVRLAEKNKDINFQMLGLNGIGWVYMEMSQYAEAIKWFKKAFAVSSAEAYKDNYSSIYSNMAPCYGALGNLDSAEYCIDQCIVYANRYENLRVLANAYVTKANVELNKDRIASGVNYLKRAVDIRKVLNDPYYILSDLSELSNTYATLGKTDEGLAYATEAMQIARKYGFLSKLPMIYTSLESNYLQRKDYKALSETLHEHMAVKDSVYQMALAEELADKEARYETDKKEREISRQKLVIGHERDRQKAILFSLSGVILLIGAGSLLFMQRNRARQEKKQFSSILDAEQKERIRIARDLHDSIGQMLSVVKMNVSNIHYAASGTEKKQTASTLEIVDKTIQEVRHISHNLIPEELNFGIVSALEEMCSRINAAEDTVVTLDIETSIAEHKFATQFELSLYRIVQEILNNMLKHAEASQIIISMKNKNNLVLLTIHDDGIGFDTAGIRESKGLGWKNVLARVSLLNGKMTVQSEKISGTQIEIAIPNERHPAEHDKHTHRR
ncbi:MAG: tetratricopeptide repeat protein, partial [Sphingobacteriales bacterium]